MSLPNFMCIGAAKSGTTTMHDILRQHPDIYVPSFKEPHFFDIPENFINGLSWYENTYFRKANKKIISEFTPSYFFDENVPKRIFTSLGGDMKFLVIVRNPVDRAYSHYLHSKRDFHEVESFKDALDLENMRLNKYKDESDYLSYLRHSYIRQGLYSKMLERYLKYYSLDNFLFINFEDEFLLKIDITIKKILDFLEVDSSVRLNTNIKRNPSSIERSKTLKLLMNKKGWLRDVIKFILPSMKLRQIINNKIQEINIKEFTPDPLSSEFKSYLLERYFREDILNFERIIDKKTNW